MGKSKSNGRSCVRDDLKARLKLILSEKSTNTDKFSASYKKLVAIHVDGTKFDENK